jgi:hypothetical protein
LLNSRWLAHNQAPRRRPGTGSAICAVTWLAMRLVTLFYRHRWDGKYVEAQPVDGENYLRP